MNVRLRATAKVEKPPLLPVHGSTQTPVPAGDRDPALVAADLKDGYITEDTALSVYGCSGNKDG